MAGRRVAGSETVRSIERRHEEYVHKVLTDQKTQLELDYRRALDLAEVRTLPNQPPGKFRAAVPIRNCAPGAAAAAV